MTVLSKEIFNQIKNNQITKLVIDIESIRQNSLDEWLLALKYNASLECIEIQNLYAYDLSYAGDLLGVIKHIPSLQVVSLSGNGLGDKFVQELVCFINNNPFTQHLDLTSNHLGSGAAQALAESIKINITLQHVNLDSNFISTEGTAYQEIKQYTARNKLIFTCLAPLREFNKTGDLSVSYVKQQMKVLEESGWLPGAFDWSFFCMEFDSVGLYIKEVHRLLTAASYLYGESQRKTAQCLLKPFANEELNRLAFKVLTHVESHILKEEESSRINCVVS